MAIKIILGYSGSLSYFSERKRKLPWLFSLFWTYNHNHSDESTRSPFYLFQAVKKLHDKGRITPSNFKMLFWGNIDKRNKLLAEKIGIGDYLEVRGYLEKNESFSTLNACTLLFLPLESTGLGQPLFIPGKLFEYLKTGKPILALCEEDSDAGKIINQSKTAFVVAPKDIEQIAKTIDAIITDPNILRNMVQQNDYVKQFSWHETTRKIAKIFSELM